VNRAQRLAAVATSLSAAPFVFAGCAAPASGFEQAIPPAVIASDANIADVAISTSSNLGGSGFWIRIYLLDVSDDALVGSIDAALVSAYRAAPSKPTDVTLDVKQAPRSADDSLTMPGLKLSDAVVDALGLRGHTLDRTIELSIDELVERYGAWGAAG